ncbi:MAG: DNA endonuclease SmrA [Pseudomonadota bacterium]
MPSDEDMFFKEMGDVARHRPSGRVGQAQRRASSRDSSLQERRDNAVAAEVLDRNILKEEGIEPLDPWYVLEFKRPGVQNGVFRKLKQGRYDTEARLDLHRMTVKRAREELFDFIEESHRLGLRCVAVVHGRGEKRNGEQGHSILKGCTNHWLRQLETVQAFHSAQPRHGGTGAVYVLLKKSEEKKRENRERFMKGRTETP